MSGEGDVVDTLMSERRQTRKRNDWGNESTFLFPRPVPELSLAQEGICHD
jgi:hypothetical protein